MSARSSAEPRLPLEERARILANCLVVSSNLDVYEPACLAAMLHTRADALKEAAEHLERLGFRGEAELVRELLDLPP